LREPFEDFEDSPLPRSFSQKPG